MFSPVLPVGAVLGAGRGCGRAAGRRFKGRGPIQLTGRYNYGEFGKWAKAKGYVRSAGYFIANPHVVATSRWGFLAASWYWTVARPMNTYADRGDIVGATRAVNGGTNGLADRTHRWNRCRAIGNPLLPDLAMHLNAAATPERLDISEDHVHECIPGGKRVVPITVPSENHTPVVSTFGAGGVKPSTLTIHNIRYSSGKGKQRTVHSGDKNVPTGNDWEGGWLYPHKGEVSMVVEYTFAAPVDEHGRPYAVATIGFREK